MSMPGTKWPGMECNLLGLGEEVRRIGVERHQSDRLNRREFLGHDLGRVQQIDAFEHFVFGVREHLDAQLPLRVCAGLDGVGEIAAMEVRVHTAGDLRFLPHQ